MKPVRIQRSRQKKQVSPNGLPIIYVGRGSQYGNDFRIGEKSPKKWLNIFDNKDIDKYLGKILDRGDCVYLFKKYMSWEMAEFTEANKGRNVSCWCGLQEKCHGDILLKMWND